MIYDLPLNSDFVSIHVHDTIVIYCTNIRKEYLHQPWIDNLLEVKWLLRSTCQHAGQRTIAGIQMCFSLCRSGEIRVTILLGLSCLNLCPMRLLGLIDSGQTKHRSVQHEACSFSRWLMHCRWHKISKTTDISSQLFHLGHYSSRPSSAYIQILMTIRTEIKILHISHFDLQSA